MTLHETIAPFLAAQLDFIFFFYGLAFMLLGTVCFAIARMREHESAWIPMGLFALLHGATEWLDLIALVVADDVTFMLLRTALMAGSFLLLLEFARQKAIQLGLRPFPRTLHLALMLLVALGAAVGGPPMAGAFARYAIGFPGALAACVVIAIRAHAFTGTARHLGYSTAAGFALYALATGLIVPAAPFWPANVINQTSFAEATGIPIQLVRGFLACQLAFTVWATWGLLLIKELASDRYTAHLRRQFAWTLSALVAVLMLGWALTQFLGGVYRQNVEQSAHGDINLLASRLNGETAIVDGMVKALAGSPTLLPLLTGGSAQDDRRARTVLDLDVDASGARFGAILDSSGALVASSDHVNTHDASAWPASPWFQKALAGQAGSHFAFEPADRGRYYFASYPVRRDDGSIAGVAVLQKSLERLDADLRAFARAYYFIDPDGIVVLTNRSDSMLRALWPLPAGIESTVPRQYGKLDNHPLAGNEIRDATWVTFDGERGFVRRMYINHSQWSVVLSIPSAKIFANRIVGIIVTLLVTLMVLIYFFGKEYGIRDRIQLDRRVELQAMARDLRLKATTDPLTGLYNRAKFNETLAEEIARARRYGSSLALILFDIDHFKQVNDVYGHQAGDDVLVQLSQIASEHVRSTDLLVRWGGEEFVILAPGVDGPAAFQAAEKLRVLVERTAFKSVVGTITCSFGTTQYFAGDTPETLLERADGALYRAKLNGRNRTEPASMPGTNDFASVA